MGGKRGMLWGQEEEHRTGQTDALNQLFSTEKVCAVGLAGALH